MQSPKKKERTGPESGSVPFARGGERRGNQSSESSIEEPFSPSS